MINLREKLKFLSKETSEIETQWGVSVEKKPPVHGIIFYGIWSLVVFVFVFLLWAFFASIESAAIAPGKIVVAGNRRVVQHLEGGIISGIYVKNGQAVRRGELLLKIDNTQSSVKLTVEKNEVLRQLANEARLMALIEDKTQIVFPSMVLTAAAVSTDIKKFLENQTASFAAERAATSGNLKILKQRVLQLEEQIAGVNAQLQSTTAQLKLMKEELTSLRILAKEELVDRSRLLSTEREEQRLMGSRGEYQANIAHLRQKIGETQLAIIAERDKLNKTWNEELRDVRGKLAIATDREKSAQDIDQRTNVLSPVDGVATNLSVFTIGGVVKPGETLLEIVPQTEALLVEARINPLDIDVVHVGLSAKIVLSALKTRTTPTLLGKVNYVAADATIDPHTQQNYYEARIDIAETELKKIQQEKKLYPGMPVEVMIITNKMSPWNYFMDPIQRSFRKAFRED